MNRIAAICVAAVSAVAFAGSAIADATTTAQDTVQIADGMKKGDAMAKDAMTKGDAMAKDTMGKKDAMGKADAMAKDSMAKDTMKADMKK